MIKLWLGSMDELTTSALGKAAKARPQVLILAPTRELAMQSHQVVTDLAEANTNPRAWTSVRGVCIYGGVSKGAQKAELQLFPEVVVATPGRLQDLIEEGVLDLSGSLLPITELDHCG